MRSLLVFHDFSTELNRTFGLKYFLILLIVGLMKAFAYAIRMCRIGPELLRFEYSMAQARNPTSWAIRFFKIEKWHAL